MASGDHNPVQLPAGAVLPAGYGSGQPAMLAEILAQISREALQGEDLDAVLRGIVDCLVQRLPVAIATMHLSWGLGFLTSPKDLGSASENFEP